MLLNLVRFFNIYNVDEANKITLVQYSRMMKARALQEADKIHMIHVQSWANNSVKATDKKGKPVYKSFKDFYDHEKAINELNEYKEKQSKKQLEHDRLKEIARRMLERERSELIGE